VACWKRLSLASEEHGHEGNKRFALAARERRVTAYHSGLIIHTNGSAMNASLPGIHHVTAVTADAQKNIDFYCGLLGLRLVKLTVNFDDPQSYHLYYGDERGSPGTIMTFFAWPGAPRGRIGPPQVTVTSFATHAGALAFWSERLREHQVAIDCESNHFGEPVLSFTDPDGMKLAIVGVSKIGGQTATGDLPRERALHGFHSVTICEEGYEKTARLLTDVMSFRLESSEGNRFRYRSSVGTLASVVDLVCSPDARHGALGAGIVHHVAFRTPDDANQQSWRHELVRLGYNVSPVMDRTYFHSIYFREPGGVLFEIATDKPGFAVDEPADALGTSLKLPVQYEPYRSQLDKLLPKLRLPEWPAQSTS
jgi:glyoxalase family protein